MVSRVFNPVWDLFGGILFLCSGGIYCIYFCRWFYVVCLCFDFRWLETEIGSDIVGFMETESVWCMDQDVGERRSVTVFFGIIQHKIKALGGHFGTLQHGIIFQFVHLTTFNAKVFASSKYEFALQSSTCRFEAFLQNCRRGWTDRLRLGCWLIEPGDWGYVRKITSHMTLMGWWTS